MPCHTFLFRRVGAGICLSSEVVGWSLCDGVACMSLVVRLLRVVCMSCD